MGKKIVLNFKTHIKYLCLMLALCFVVMTQSHAQIDFEKSALNIKRQNDSVIQFEVEIARTPQERAQGLMQRTSLADNAGMLFLWPGAGLRQFWMKDTLISLDILFFDEEGVLVHYEDKTTPNSQLIISSLMPVSYVLEIKAGQRDANKLEIGDYLISPPSWRK